MLEKLAPTIHAWKNFKECGKSKNEFCRPWGGMTHRVCQSKAFTTGHFRWEDKLGRLAAGKLPALTNRKN
jgi:hypothetical protein